MNFNHKKLFQLRFNVDSIDDYKQEVGELGYTIQEHCFSAKCFSFCSCYFVLNKQIGNINNSSYKFINIIDAKQFLDILPSINKS